VLLTASLSSAAPNAAGDFLLTSIAAVLLGMTMFEPGRPNVPGTLVGALTIGMLSNGLVLLGAQYYVQDICLGLIILASVSLSGAALTRAAFRV
jgi:ribose transport system permease protein